MALSSSLVASDRALALVEREVERAIAPYRGVLSPARLGEMASFIRDALLTHPVASAEVAQVAPPAVDQSGELDTIPDEAGLEGARRAGGGSKGSGGDGW